MTALMISTFSSATDRSPTMNATTWGELVVKLSTPMPAPCTVETCGLGAHVHESGGCRWKYTSAWSPATYPACAPRKAGNVEAVSVLALDIDHATDEQLAAVEDRLRSLRHIAHASHHDRPGDRRVRIVIDLTRPVLAGEWSAFWSAAVDHLDVPADVNARDVSRIYFTPSRPSDADFYFISNDGAPLDVDDLLASAAIVSAAIVSPPTTPARSTTVAPRTVTDDERLRRASAYLARIPGAVQGSDGSGATFKAAMHMLVGFDLSETDAERLIADEFNPRCVPPWSEREIRHKIEDVARSCKQERGYLLNDRDSDAHASKSLTSNATRPHESKQASRERSLRWTELDNAERLAAAHGDRLRCVHGKWFGWDGRRWRKDRDNSAIIAAKAVVASLYTKAAELSQLAANGDEQAGSRAKELAKWAGSSSKASSIRAMVSLAESEDPIAATADMFDRSPWLFNCENGTLDLQTGELGPHRQTDMITMLASVSYATDATCPRWDEFLSRILPDVEVRALVQRFLGYCLTGDVREQVLAFAYGSGANGKSVLFDVMLAILGDYGLRAAADLVLAKHGETHPTELADLEGRRFVVVSEIEQGKAWAESLIKRITGDTTITARKMREDYRSFAATHKLAIAANTKPTVRGTDHAIWRRMRLVPFEVTIPPAERDKDLVSKLLAERAGILRWAVQGCLAWQRDGLGEAAAVNVATEAYAEDQDVLGHWIAESCVASASAWSSTGALYENYAAWCSSTGRDPWTRETMRARLLERPGIKEARRDHGRVRGLSGIALRSDRSHLEAVG